jgi:HSP20 family molecular chaperone IbpA
MTETQQLGSDVPVSRYEYEESVVLAADMGVTDASAEVVGDTVIVVAGNEQYDLETPDGEDARAFIKNGVLTVEVSQ